MTPAPTGAPIAAPVTDGMNRFDDGCDRIMQTIEERCIDEAAMIMMAREPEEEPA